MAWAVDSNGKPLRSVLLVGQTQQEAEARAKEWIARQERLNDRPSRVLLDFLGF